MREKLIELLCKAHNAVTDKSLENHEEWGMTYAEQIETEADSLIANGVTIPVRCKDCVNYCGFEHCKNGICDVDSVSKRAVYPNDFCSYGERKGDGNA